ncbi:alpha-2-macroglobulin receptor-associated protein-like [Lingula anatina]|nr:alpha-2-macroglobulin receptor-associated protein-like [Lingula anatina]|eukprot:XP_013420577.2 alpha-2-macroglobulin receptor-associated protein-like [Lingula anatina]
MDYERLEFLAKKVPDGETKFTEPKVHELWMQAKQVDFSPEELVAFEEELRHFEHKLKKHADMTKEFEETVKDYKKSGKDIPLKVEKMDEKNRDYAKKIKKHHTELQRKIDKRHIEL